MDKALGERVRKLLKERQGIQLDIGGGWTPQPGYVNMDIRALPTVDIVWNIEHFPWPLPDESCLRVMASHVIEHVNPHYGDARVYPLIQLLLKKKIITPAEAREYIGEIKDLPRLLRFMDEVWRVLQPDGQFMIAFPHGYSTGYLQDPTHLAARSEVTLAYFDPLETYTGGVLYGIYQPKPFKIDHLSFSPAGNVEVILIKRRDDRSYHGK